MKLNALISTILLSTMALAEAQNGNPNINSEVLEMKDEGALWSWIACAARHAATDLRRTGGRYLHALGQFAEWWHSAVGSPDSDNSLPAALETALSKLSPDERALIEGRYFADDSLATIAARHTLTVRAVEGRLAQLRTRLRELIAEELQSSRP